MRYVRSALVLLLIMFCGYLAVALLVWSIVSFARWVT